MWAEQSTLHISGASLTLQHQSTLRFSLCPVIQHHVDGNDWSCSNKAGSSYNTAGSSHRTKAEKWVHCKIFITFKIKKKNQDFWTLSTGFHRSLYQQILDLSIVVCITVYTFLKCFPAFNTTGVINSHTEQRNTHHCLPKHTKPHIKHPVCFIKHEVSDSLKVCSFLFHMINQTTLLGEWGNKY